MFLGWDSSAAVLLFRLQINMRAAVRVTLLKGAVVQAGLARPGRLVAEGAARTSTGRSPDQIIEG